MRCRLAIEDIEPGHHVAWALDLPGCFSSSQTGQEAVARAPARVAHYFRWIAGHDPSLPAPDGPFEVEVVETFHAHDSAEDPSYLVNAFFDDDLRPLGYWDVEAGLRLLQWTRRDLIDVARALSPEQLSRTIAGQVQGSIGGILEHVARAENWYLGQLGMALPGDSLPQELLARLEAVRAQMLSRLPALAGDERVTAYRGESWSARKVLRRTLWHERDHTQHIAQLMAQWP
jgi:uncharacterized damage-inducible protein DinB